MGKRILSIALAMLMCLSMIPTTVVSAMQEKFIDRGTFERENPDALHFYIRHWHSKAISETEGTQFQTGSTESVGRYFVVAEGYITLNDDDDNDNYSFYFVYQNDMDDNAGNHHKAGEVALVDDVTDSAYLDGLDTENGKIELKSVPLDTETFTTFSISAGHDAVSYDKIENTITIQYDPDIHLVKGHAFYVKSDELTKRGAGATDGEGIFGKDELTKQDPKIDAVDVYTYKKDKNGHTAGEVVKDDNNGNAVRKSKDIEEDKKTLAALGLDINKDVEVQKVYNTNDGLHTNKFATSHGDDGRTFDLTLQSWYTAKYPPLVGMVLDASGSMAFASDVPSVINYKKLGLDSKAISKLESKVKILEDRGFESKGVQVPFPQSNSLVGYYEFKPAKLDLSNPTKNYRTWFLNTQTGGKPSSYEGNETKYTSKGVEDYFAKIVKQPTNNTIDFTDQKTLVKSQDYDENATWGTVPVNLSETNGFNLNYSSVAMVLEKAPTSNKFTLSFDLNQTADKPDVDDDIEILYIGGLKGNINDLNYFHVVRSGKNIVGMMGNDKKNPLFTLNNLYNDSGTINHKLTFTFEESVLKVYVDNTLRATKNVSNLSGKNVIFAPFKDKFDGRTVTDNNKTTQEQFFYIDNIYLFDGTALDVTDVENLNLWSGKDLDATDVKRNEDAFLTENELALLMNPQSTDNSSLGYAGYNYFVFDARSGTRAYLPLGYIKVGTTPYGNTDSLNGNGWYYVSSGNWDTLLSKRVTKSILGIRQSTSDTSIIFKNIINYRNNTADSGEGAAPDLDASIGGNSNDTYTSSETGPVKFYLDSAGNLRCFFGINDSYYTSYVYELGDRQYIRTESLQRAIGDFVTRLNEKSPQSKVSAVKFSAEKADIQQLVLLDWTNNPGESASILSLLRGAANNRVTESTQSQNATSVNQFNYMLTGGTFTHTGLNAFQNYLYTEEKIKEENLVGDKYLIIFTDGAYEGDASASYKITDELKGKGFTVFTVLLDGGSLQEGSTDYNKAHDFLLSLSGTEKYEGTGNKEAYNNNAEKYFFSISKGKKQLGSQADGMNDTDILTKIFSDEILNQLDVNQDDYNVKDYIDPRFDLVDAKGVVWHLNANGKVKAGNKNYDLSKTGSSAEIEISEGYDENAKKPTLLYDSSKDMYYLTWKGQEIPGCAIGAKSLAVWNATFTIKAKDDFIGGNAILTNGNEKMMNYVYSDEDKGKDGTGQDISSGVDDMISESIEDLPSKGFPRVSVNVAPPEETEKVNHVIYMGEELNAKDVTRVLIDAAKEESKDNGAYYYWEYVTRFVNFFNDPANKKLAEKLHGLNWKAEEFDPNESDTYENGRIISDRMYQLIQSGELSVDRLSELLLDEGNYVYLPYIYLPDNPKLSSASNSTGNSKEHLGDVIGYLFFQLEEQYKADGETESQYPSYPNNIVTDTETRKSQLTMRFMVLEPDDRADWNNSQVITEEVFKRNTDYKPAVGTPEEEDVLIKGTIETQIVTGEIALQVVLSDEAVAKVKSVGELVTYTADLYKGNTVIGTFTVVIDPSTLENNNIVNATIEYGDEFKYNFSEDGLPIGTYTLKNGKGENVPEGLEFGDITLVSDKSAYKDELFSLGTDNDKPDKYLATINGNSFVLGDKNQKTYTNCRFGLAQVELKAIIPQPTNPKDPSIQIEPVDKENIPDLGDNPKTGDNSNMTLWLYVMGVAGLGIIVFRKRKRI